MIQFNTAEKEEL